MRLIKMFVICILSTALLSGCLPHTELDEQAIVEAIGIDYSDGEYEVTVQYFNMEGTGGNAPIDSTKANVVNISGKGDSVSAALNSASVKCGKSFMYGITGIIILGREALNQDILKTLSFAESYYQSNPSVLAAAADKKASDILGVKFKDGVISVEHLKMLLNNAQYYGICENVMIHELLSEQRLKYTGTVLPVLSAKEQGGETTDDGKTVEITSGILLKNKAYARDLSFKEMSGLQLLSENPANTLVSVEAEDEKVAVSIYDINADIKHSYSNEGLEFLIKLHANGKYTDSQLKSKNASFSQNIEALCAEYLKERIEKALTATALENSCDPCGLKYVISSADYSEWLRVSESFGDFLSEAHFIVTCDIDIDRFGIIH